MGKPANISDGVLTRKIACQWLFEILHHKKSLDEVLAAAENDADWVKLERRDKGFVRNLVMISLRRKGEVDWLLAHFLKKTPPKRSKVSEILLLGVVQLLYLDVPDHAAIDISVRLAKLSDKSRHLAKLVNAILRSVTREGEALRAAQDLTLTNFPPWLVAKWRAHYGDEVCHKMCSSLLLPAALDLTVKNKPEEWGTKLNGSVLIGNSIRVDQGGLISDIEGYETGDWWVQDVSASLAVPLFGDLKGKQALDLCAAPGGKTAGLIMAGANVTVIDNTQNRMQRLTENLERLKLKAELITQDLLTYEAEEKYDAVLLDAPCSATGTIRRHPDILHLKTEKSVQRSQDIQAKMLEKSLTFLKPGGTLIYCTCSLEHEEGEAQIEKLLAAHETIKRQPIKTEEVNGHDEWLTEAGDLRLLPHYSTLNSDDDKGMDGFFISRLIVN